MNIMKKVFIIIIFIGFLFFQKIKLAEQEFSKLDRKEKINRIIEEFPTRNFRKKLVKFINSRKAELLRRKNNIEQIDTEKTWHEKFKKEFDQSFFEDEILNFNFGSLCSFELLVIDSLSIDQSEIFPKIDASELFEIKLN